MNKKLFLSVAALAACVTLFAQEPDGCITHKAMNEYFSQNPEAKKAFDAREEILAKLDAEAFKNGYKDGYKTSDAERSGSGNSTQGTVYYIPVVFHILHQNGVENITDQQAINCVNEMTTRFRKLNSDTAQTVAAFKSIASDVQIEFRLATIDPNGNCTNGIVRHVDPHTVWLQGNPSWYTHTWNPTKYLNIYTVQSINGTAAAYTYLPGTWGTGAAQDVIVARHDYVGSTGTSTSSHGFCITHETGHWLNLSHTWGSTNNPGVACGNDNVTDTPVTEGSNLVCPLTDNSCTPGIVENVQNYMDYSYCSTMYTAGQVTRMRTAANSTTGGRSTVISAANLTATGVTNPQVCVPVANFHASTRTACPNAIITFSDSSSNAVVTGWQWSFPGGTFQNSTTATSSNPQVSWATPGTYAVSYTASTSAGSNAITKNSMITINTNIASYNNVPFFEGFESTTLPGTDWNIYNTTGINWAISTAAAATGVKSAEIDNMANVAGTLSSLVSTSFNISTFSAPTFTFKMAYQQQATANADKLQVLTSTDCGNSWISRWSRSGSTLATVTPPSSTPFTPSSSQFNTYTVNINGVAGQSNVRFRFLFTADPAGQGNNLFIDDINLYDASAGVASIEEQIGLNIYPNPSSGKINIDLNLAESHNIAVNVTDMLGRTVESISSKQYNAGEVTLNLAAKQVYQPGVYFVNMDVDGKKLSRRIVVSR